MDDEKSDQVGYGSPPAHTRFKKGESGNPNGRPKGAQNLATVFTKTLREKVTITENGCRKVITKLQAAVKQLVNKAAAGDPKAIRQLLALAASLEERPASSESSDTPLSRDDQKIFQNILERFSNQEGANQNERDTK